VSFPTNYGITITLELLFYSFGYSLTSKSKINDVLHLENSSSGARNSTYNALISFFTIFCIRYPRECFLNAFYGLHWYQSFLLSLHNSLSLNDPNPCFILCCYTIHYHCTIHCIDCNCQNHCPHLHCFHHFLSLPEEAAWIGEVEAVLNGQADIDQDAIHGQSVRGDFGAGNA